MSKKLLLVGGGGHCKSVLDCLLETNQFSDISIIDKKENIGKTVLGVRVVGYDNDLSRLFADGYCYAFVTVGYTGDPEIRKNLFSLVSKVGFTLPNIIDPSATVSRHATIESGIFVGKNVVVNAGCTIKNGAIINTGALLEHDCLIEEFCHIAPGAVLCGKVHIGANTHIGAQSVIKQQIRIGSGSMIGMGSVVLKDIADGVIAYGNPCKEVTPDE